MNRLCQGQTVAFVTPAPAATASSRPRCSRAVPASLVKESNELKKLLVAYFNQMAPYFAGGEDASKAC